MTIMNMVGGGGGGASLDKMVFRTLLSSISPSSATAQMPYAYYNDDKYSRIAGLYPEQVGFGDSNMQIYTLGTVSTATKGNGTDMYIMRVPTSIVALSFSTIDGEVYPVGTKVTMCAIGSTFVSGVGTQYFVASGNDTNYSKIKNTAVYTVTSTSTNSCSCTPEDEYIEYVNRGTTAHDYYLFVTKVEFP